MGKEAETFCRKVSTNPEIFFQPEISRSVRPYKGSSRKGFTFSFKLLHPNKIMRMKSRLIQALLFPKTSLGILAWIS